MAIKKTSLRLSLSLEWTTISYIPAEYNILLETGDNILLEDWSWVILKEQFTP